MIKGLPERLKELRISNNLTQKAVSERLNLSTSIISGYETGERSPSTEILLALSYLYHCSTDYLLGKNTDRPSTVLNVDGLTREQIALLSSLIDTMKR